MALIVFRGTAAGVAEIVSYLVCYIAVTGLNYPYGLSLLLSIRCALSARSGITANVVDVAPGHAGVLMRSAPLTLCVGLPLIGRQSGGPHGDDSRNRRAVRHRSHRQGTALLF